MKKRTTHILSKKRRSVFNKRGSIILILTLLIPLFAILFIGAVNLALLTNSKMKFQIASDRSAFAAASKMSEIMNLIAKQNNLIIKAHDKLVENFGPNSQQSSEECENRVREYSSVKSSALLMIGQLLESFRGEVEAAAKQEAKRLLPSSDLSIIAGADLSAEDFGEEKFDIVCGSVDGLFLDPNNVSSSSHEGLTKKLYKSDRYIAVVVKLSSADKKIDALSAAAPAGGSMSDDRLSYYPVLIPVMVALENMGVESDALYLQ